MLLRECLIQPSVLVISGKLFRKAVRAELDAFFIC
jgi:hypothetical protein